jgi:predicted house-cleaning noncanonical NTP pyrophosphatase (MazG superfamily)
MKKFEKLVRDKIPEIIRADGKIPVCRNLDNDEYRKELLKN